MKKVIRFLVFSLAPVVILIAYAALVELLSSINIFEYENFEFILLFGPYVTFAIIGLLYLLLCKSALDKDDETRIPFEFIIGIFLVIISNMYYFIPEIPLPPIFAEVFSSGLPISGLFTGTYLMLFVILLYRRAKNHKKQKTEKNIEPQM